MSLLADGVLWVPELRVVSLVGVARSTYHGWEAERLLERPEDGAYREMHVIEAIVIGALRARLPVPATRNAATRLRAEKAFDRIGVRARRLDDADLDLLIEPELGEVTVCYDDGDLVRAIRRGRQARSFDVVPLAEKLTEAIVGFRNHAERGAPPTKRARGRPSRRASVTPLRTEE